MTSTFGPAYDEELDGERIRTQLENIRDYMTNLDGHMWVTLQEIGGMTGYPEASISAQLRHLRKKRFGSWEVLKRRRSGGLWEYCVVPPPTAQAEKS